MAIDPVVECRVTSFIMIRALLLATTERQRNFGIQNCRVKKGSDELAPVFHIRVDPVIENVCDQRGFLVRHEGCPKTVITMSNRPLQPRTEESTTTENAVVFTMDPSWRPESTEPSSKPIRPQTPNQTEVREHWMQISTKFAVEKSVKDYKYFLFPS